ncbi:MAG TPA: tripartite tricarboxylate transporter substrate binding protein [Xanthobacteraceae bacterium]|nr:tripartite tricarboxylate transporter substrate binding protein [Xanthobacteraceae bacterium]
MTGRWLCGAVVALLLAGAAVAQPAATWPARPIHLIVPFGAGSGSDVIARIVGQKLAAKLGQPVVIENKPGGSTILGTELAARAAPDGYTLELANTTSHATTAALGIKLAFDPVKDFTPVGMLAYSPLVLLVTPGLDARSVPELIALAKAKPGKLNYASAGVGTMAHLAGALFTTMAGVDINHVPYRGTEQSMIDLMQGRIEILFGTIAPSLPQVRSGKLRALATTGLKRNAMLPDLPTLAETGLTGYEAGLWTGLVFPAGVAPGIVTRLNAQVNEVMRDPDVVALLAKQGVEVETGPPELLGGRIKTDLAKWREVVAKAGIKAQ